MEIERDVNMKKEEMDRLKTDLREVLLFIKYSKDKKELADLLRTEPNFRKMDYKTVQVLNVLTNLKMKIEERKGEEDMCIAVDEMCADARAEGYDLGKTEGYDLGKTEGEWKAKTDMAIAMLKSGLMSYEQISEITKFSIEQLKELEMKV